MVFDWLRLKGDAVSEGGGNFPGTGKGVDKVDKSATRRGVLCVLAFRPSAAAACLLVKLGVCLPKGSADLFLCFHGLIGLI